MRSLIVGRNCLLLHLWGIWALPLVLVVKDAFNTIAALELVVGAATRVLVVRAALNTVAALLLVVRAAFVLVVRAAVNTGAALLLAVRAATYT